MIELPESRLVKKAFNLAVKLDGTRTLIKSVKMTINEIDKRTDWENLNHIPKRELQTEVKQKVNSWYDRKWLKELAESAKENKETRNYVRTKNLKTRFQNRELPYTYQCEGTS